MNALFETVAQSPEAGGVHAHFARLMKRLDRGEHDSVALSSFLVSWRTQQGDVCLDLREVAGKSVGEALGGAFTSLPDSILSTKLPSLKQWMRQLEGSEVVGKPGEEKPLILDGKGRIYLFRYREYQDIIAGGILNRAASPFFNVNDGGVRAHLDEFFPLTQGVDMQRMAAVAALRRKFAVISGGPGTGKTTTVVRILALIAGIGTAGGKAPRIALAAPTGKAAARLRASVAGALERLDLPQATRDLVPAEAFTLHRLLGSIPGSPYFRHHAKRRLPHDLVVVDESSMADMALMAKLVAALRDEAALIIVGDRDQLSSVEAGAVLGDICDTGARHAWSRGFAIDAGIAGQTAGNGYRIDDVAPPLADTVVVLDRNYRFSDSSGIGAFRAAVRDGNHELALDILTSRKYDDIVLHDPHGEVKFEDFVAQRIREGFGALMETSSPEKALEALASFSVLCAHRKGRCGSEHVNRIAMRAARGDGDPLRRGELYRGQPLIVTRNSYALRLFNGDVGVVAGSGAQRVFFPSAEGGMRGVSPSRLPECEPAYAITVHRSQGSEYDRVLVVLPDQASKVLTRELLYTAVTRARSGVELWGSPDIIRDTVRASIERRSGLRDALWAGDTE